MLVHSVLCSPSPATGPALPWGHVTASWAPCHDPSSSHRGVAPRCERSVLAEAVAAASSNGGFGCVTAPGRGFEAACPRGGHSLGARPPPSSLAQCYHSTAQPCAEAKHPQSLHQQVLLCSLPWGGGAGWGLVGLEVWRPASGASVGESCWETSSLHICQRLTPNQQRPACSRHFSCLKWGFWEESFPGHI